MKRVFEVKIFSSTQSFGIVFWDLIVRFGFGMMFLGINFRMIFRTIFRVIFRTNFEFGDSIDGLTVNGSTVNVDG